MEKLNDKKVLFTTSIIKNKLYDYLKENAPDRSIFKYSWKRRGSLGLRFLKYNIPAVNILEYPTWKEYKKKIDSNDYDIIGFSFYTNEIPQILKMVEYARQKGIKVCWAGNYGVLNPGINKYFDKVFTGYAERAVAHELGLFIDKIEHPPIIQYYSWNWGMQIAKVGMLQTARGCPLHCKFCQTPVFSPKTEIIPLESIKKVLLTYKKRGVKEINIIDESFGIQTAHSDEVVRLLHSLGFYWTTMTRVDILNKNLDDWLSKGLFGVFIGIENLSQDVLDFINKKETINNTLNLVERLKKHHIFTMGYYVIGFENDTGLSIKEDIKKLKQLDMDLYQLCVITPLAQTPLWDFIDNKYGIIEKDLEKFDAKHLVWNHPNIKPDEMIKILKESRKQLFSSAKFFKTMKKNSKKLTETNYWGGIKYQLLSALKANVSCYIKKEYKYIKD